MTRRFRLWRGPQPALRAAATLLVMAMALAACGADADDSNAAAAEPDPVDETVAPAAPADADVEVDAPAEDSGADNGVIEVVAVDFAFEGLPDTIDAGTRLTLVNDAESELHELVAFRLDDAEERPVADLMALPEEQMQQALGPVPTTVMLAPPGSEQVATPIGDGTLAEPGRYAIVCVIPTGVDAGEYLDAAATSDGPPDVGGGPPHIVHGMFTEVEVR